MKLRHPWIIISIAWVAAKVFRGVFRTCRYHVLTEAPDTYPGDPDCPQHYLYCLWHDAVIPPISMLTFVKRWGPGNRIKALVSPHFDGSYLTEFMKHFNVTAVRGSTSRGGARALKQLMDESERGHIWITPDGPRGPRRKLKPGIVYLASQTGMPILPHTNAISRAWDIQGSWTNQTVPKPFSHIYMLLGKPIVVPPDLTREQLDAYQALVESEMQRLQDLTDRFAAGEFTQLPAEEEQRESLKHAA